MSTQFVHEIHLISQNLLEYQLIGSLSPVDWMIELLAFYPRKSGQFNFSAIINLCPCPFKIDCCVSNKIVDWREMVVFFCFFFPPERGTQEKVILFGWTKQIPEAITIYSTSESTYRVHICIILLHPIYIYLFASTYSHLYYNCILFSA
jgi:hypothetical protein